MKFVVALLLSLSTVNSIVLPAPAEFVQSKVVREDMAKQLLELDPTLSNVELVEMM